MSSTVAEVVVRMRDEVSTAAGRAASAMDDLAESERGAQRAADALADSGARIERFGRSAGDVGSSAKKLAGALDLVVPGAGNLARAVDDVADVADVAGGSLGSFGITAAGLGPILVAAGAALATYHVVMTQVRAAADELHRTQERMTRSTAGFAGLVESAVAAEHAADLAEMSDAQREQIQIQERWAESLAVGTAALREEMTLTDQRSQRAQEITEALDAAEDAAIAGAAADMRAAAAATAKAKADREVAAASKARAEAPVTMVPLDAINNLIAAEQRLAAMIRESTLDLMGPQERQIALLREQIAQVHALGAAYPEMAADAARALGLLEARVLEAEITPTAGGGGGAGGSSAPATVTLDPTAAAAIASGMSSGTLGGLASGAMSIAGFAGPIGMAVSAGIELTMKAASGNLAADLLASAETFILGMQKLPEEMTKLLVGFFEEVIPGLIEAIPAAIDAVLSGFITLFDPSTWIRVAEAIGTAVFDVVASLPRIFADFVVSAFEAIRDDILALFGFDPRAAGEGAGPLNLFGREGGFSDFGRNVTNIGRGRPAFTGENNARDRGRGGDTHVHVTGMAIGTVDGFARELSRHMGTSARRIKLPAGSVAG